MDADFSQIPPLIPLSNKLTNSSYIKSENYNNPKEQDAIYELSSQVAVLQYKFEELEKASVLQNTRIKESIYIVFLSLSAIFFIKFAHALADRLRNLLDNNKTS